VSRLCVLGYDALEIELVEELDLPNLKQAEYGKTDISEFDKASTPILWGSAITGKNLESRFTEEKGNSTMRDMTRKPYHALMSYSPSLAMAARKFLMKIGVLTSIRGSVFKVNVKDDLGLDTVFDEEDRVGVNIPAFNKDNNTKYTMDDYFKQDINDEEYVKEIWNCFDRTKEKFLQNMDKDLIMAWFCPADRVGHIFRPNLEVMEETYKRLDEFAGRVRKEFDGDVMIISDHGMKEMGDFGDHSNISYGYWSFNRKLGLRNPKLVDFRYIVEDILNDSLDPSKYNQGEIVETEERDREHSDDEAEIKSRLEELGYFD
jgi:hypothetical protein